MKLHLTQSKENQEGYVSILTENGYYIAFKSMGITEYIDFLESVTNSTDLKVEPCEPKSLDNPSFFVTELNNF